MHRPTVKHSWTALLLFVLALPVHAEDVWSESYRLEAMGNFAKAAKALEPLLQDKPVNEFAVLRHGWLNYLQGNYGAAIRDYQTALDRNPKSLDARLGLTLPMLAQKRWRETASYATAVLKDAPWNYYAHIRLMAAEEGQQQWKALAHHAASVAERYPSDPTLFVYLARAHANLGNDKAAAEAYRSVLERVPNHVEAQGYLARQ